MLMMCVERFVERCVANGMDVFRVFDALNDPQHESSVASGT